MSTNTEFPSMNIGSLSINTFNNGLTIMDRNVFPASIFLKTDVSIGRMILNGNFILLGGMALNKIRFPNQQYVVPINTDTVTIDPSRTILIIDPAGPLAVLNVVMPSNPFDGSIVQISITRDIATINHSAPGGATIDFPLISAVAPSTQHYVYRNADNTWYILVTAEGPSSVTLTCIQDQTPNPNVQLCSSATSLQGFFNNGIDKYMDIPIADANIAIGLHANNSLGGGVNNLAIGNNALELNIISNNNVSIGVNTMSAMITGSDNTVLGYNALSNSTTGNNNTAIGSETLSAAFLFNEMVAIGYSALSLNAASTECTAVGFRSLAANTTGVNNTAVGYSALNTVVIGDNNTAFGHRSLEVNTGSDNTAIGSSSLLINTFGDSNTSIGRDALISNITGNGNIAIGESAGANILLDDNILIGNTGLAGDTGIIRIGTENAHTDTFLPTNTFIGTTGAPGQGYLGLLNEYVDISGPYGDGVVVPDPSIAFGGPTISVWLIPLSVASMPTGLTVTMPVPVASGQVMHISFVGVAGPPIVVGTGIIYTPNVDPAHTIDRFAIDTGANSYSSMWYVSPASGLWTRI